MTTARVFRTNRSQAVRLPKAAAFPEGVRDVEVIIDGEARILRPVTSNPWDDFFNQPGIDIEEPEDPVSWEVREAL